VARPMPEPAPVTSATFPCKFMMLSFRGYLRCVPYA